mmetsp:Transcript_24908/g.58448  ORF Transcript_24908/g.58448 Transcript_24908/m.58448 type:complete len:240 (+) Transcript_24908:393-1112(+)
MSVFNNILNLCCIFACINACLKDIQCFFRFLFFLGPLPRNRSPTDRILFDMRLLETIHIFLPNVRMLLCSSSRFTSFSEVSERICSLDWSSLKTRTSSPWILVTRFCAASNSVWVEESSFLVLRRSFCSNSYLSSSCRFNSAACFNSSSRTSFRVIISWSLAFATSHFSNVSDKSCSMVERSVFRPSLTVIASSNFDSVSLRRWVSLASCSRFSVNSRRMDSSFFSDGSRRLVSSSNLP